MSHKSDLIATDIDAYLKQHENKELLRFLTCGSVDDGKSTLIGRLLYDAKLIFEDQLEAVASDSSKVGTVAQGLDLALLVDGLQAEREQGITIDVAYRYFSTEKRKFIIADTPGHEQYTRNMVTGASNSDLAIILIDARNGVLTQTKRHSFIVSLLGIKHIIVAINKMDLMNYSEDVYQKIKADYAEFSTQLDISGDLRYLPMSALNGDNVVESSEQMSWYEGAPLMTMLEGIQISSDRNMTDFRFPVQYVNRPNLDFRGYCGTVASGLVRKGDEVMALPSKKTSKISSIITFEGELEEAFPPQAVTLTLEDEIDISRGDMLVHSTHTPHFTDRLEVQLVWMTEEPMEIGKQYLIKQAAKKTTGSVKDIKFKIDINTLAKEATKNLQLNEIGRCELVLAQRIAFDTYKENRTTGSFIIIDRLSNVTIGAGMIIGVANDQRKAAWDSEQDTSLLRANRSLITREERQKRLGQEPKVLLLTGLTGAGKSTVACALERKLFELGRTSLVLDGQTMRLGPSKDLGFDEESRSENIRRGIEIAKIISNNGIIAICSFVAPNSLVRKKARESVGDNLLLVYLSAPLEICRERDSNGIYQSENVSTIPGVSFPYQVPEDADLILPTHEITVEESVERLMEFLETKGAF
ncbi:MAG: sulfate adenylyltransferase subunit CysN [OM182 bacterium]|uniref:Sulfate adenylyltransferase subunit 1 n=1 Tax=OM182 bacterium TaxID=2510334 RepID=A0A520RWX7_9GAMM|nr:MAG: sulfate adenylyltransferase subunit CysN [OM182 bacterium]